MLDGKSDNVGIDDSDGPLLGALVTLGAIDGDGDVGCVGVVEMLGENDRLGERLGGDDMDGPMYLSILGNPLGKRDKEGNTERLGAGTGARDDDGIAENDGKVLGSLLKLGIKEGDEDGVFDGDSDAVGEFD